MHNLHFSDWLPADRVFAENAAVTGSATLSAVRRAYELLGADIARTAPAGPRPKRIKGPCNHMI